MRHILSNYINRINIEHKDGKCGYCLKELIKYEVGEELLKVDGEITLGKFFGEVGKRWKETELYKEVQSRLDKGIPLSQIKKDMEKEGYII